MKVLVADDSSVIRSRIISRLKEINGISNIYEATVVSEAYIILETENPDYILLDIRIPETNGIEILKWLQGRSLKTEAIVLTNFPYPEYERKCIKLGAKYFLNKTTEFDKVFEILTNSISDIHTSSIINQ